MGMRKMESWKGGGGETLSEYKLCGREMLGA